VANGFRRVAAARQVRRLVRDRRFDVVHANEAHGLTAAWLAGAHHQAALVVSRRVAFPLAAGRTARARYHAAQRVLAVSQFVARSVVESGLPADVVRVVYDGVEVPSLPTSESRERARQRWGTKDGEPLIGCVGYLLPGKGQESLLRSLPLIRAQVPDCRLLLAGEGPCRPKLERLAEQLGVGSAVCFAGHVQEVADVYCALDLFVFPSRPEALGSSLLAAMSFGLPCIAVAGGGAPEVIEAGSGMLAADASPEEIARAATSLLMERDRAARLGAQARHVIQQRFSADHMVEATLKIYSELSQTSGAVGSRAEADTGRRSAGEAGKT
jgi:glycosyltransferase involved in cell wall biosynthesis